MIIDIIDPWEHLLQATVWGDSWLGDLPTSKLTGASLEQQLNSACKAQVMGANTKSHPHIRNQRVELLGQLISSLSFAGLPLGWP